MSLCLIVSLIVLACPSVIAQEWDLTDKILLGAFGASLAIDYAQTRYIFKSEEYHEKNPFITSEDAAPFYFGLAGVTGFFIANSLEGKQRKGFLSAITAIQVFTIGKNYAIGVGFRF